MQILQREILRILDANLNRAREGLRVVEDMARFVLEDRVLQRKTKAIRHRLASFFASVAGAPRRATGLNKSRAPRVDRGRLIDLGRDAAGDVGKDSLTSTEAQRTTAAAFIQANFARIEESIRVLEEFSKSIAGEISPRLKSMRFEVYTLEKDYVRAANRAMNARSLKGIGLYPIFDREAIGDRDPLKVAREILLGGVQIIQYRDKVSPAAEICEVCSALRKITSEKGVIFIVNDRVDIVQAVEADGVHLGQDDVPVQSARKLLGSTKIIGKSTHSLTQARRALKEDIDYVAVGPIFSTPVKTGAHPVGTQLIARVRALTDKPVVAIGGMNRHNVRDVLSAGADAVAVISAILKAENVRLSTEALANICRRSLRKTA
jgi:thiamine-phosphate pyrophosphorylase